MNTTQFCKLAITPLSPVHLGTGHDYEPTGYVIADGALWEFDAIEALGVLPEAERRNLDTMLNSYPNDKMLRDVQGFFHANRERLMAVSRRQVRVGHEVENFYTERVGKVAQHESGGRKVQNKLIIERTAWSSGTGQVILPGSGLKGAIRTAILDSINLGKDMPDGEKGRKGASTNLQDQLLGGRFHKDPMRLIRVSDANLTNRDEFATEVRFALNRKKEKIFKDGLQLESQAERKNLYQLLECLPGFAARSFEGSLEIQTSGGVRSGDWPVREFTPEAIAKACNDFYRLHLDRELRIMKAMDYLDRDWEEELRRVLDSDAADVLNTGRAFLLRVGRHSGAESVTLNGVRSIRIMKGRGEQPEWLPEAKTLWLAGDRAATRDRLQPFGWLLIEIVDENRPRKSWTASDSQTGFVEWRGRVSDRQQQLVEELQQSLQAEAQRKQREADAARAEEEEKRRYESMSDEDKLIDALRRVFEKEIEAGTLSASSQTASERVALLRTALEWNSMESRRDAAELIRLTVKRLPWSKKSRDERQRDLIRLQEPK